MQGDILHTLLSAQTIALRLDELAKEITSDLEKATGYSADDPHNTITIVPILTGSIIFVADLIRRLPLRMKLNPMGVTSYPGKSTSSQGPQFAGLNRVPEDLTGHHVLVIDDILDSGQTFRMVCDEMKRRNPDTLHTCTLLRKPRPEAMSFPIDYVAFDIPDEFVVGYGLDYDDQYRNLPEIVTLKPEVIRDASTA